MAGVEDWEGISSDEESTVVSESDESRWENLTTAVHMMFAASSKGDVDTLKTSLRDASDANELLLEVDKWGKTALHWALNKGTAQVLVESVKATALREFLWVSGEKNRTALDVAVRNNRADVVEYLCGLTSTDESLLHGHLLLGHKPLHLARTAPVARMLVESVPSDKLTTLLLHTDEDIFQSTALQAAVRSGRDEVVEYLCSLKTPQLLLYQDLGGCTALHMACTKKSVQLLVDSVPEAMRSDFLYMRDDNEQTALHAIVEWGLAGSSAVDYYLSVVQFADELVCIKDSEGRTALHCASTEAIANLLIDAAKDKIAYINITDNEGNTAVMSMTERGAIDALQFTLECMDLDEVKSVFQVKNQKKQNVFHLACISPLVEDLYEVLEEYLDYVKMEDMFTADIYNNTPFTYLVARFCTRIFAQFILKVPLHHRQALLLQRNHKRVSCLSISEQKRFNSEFYVNEVLCFREGVSHMEFFIDNVVSNIIDDTPQSRMDHILSPEENFHYDEDLYKVMLYALNVYSLQDLHISIPNQVAASTCSVQRDHSEQTDGQSKKALPTPVLLYIDAANKSLEEIQRELYALDVSGRHSGLKVIVVRCSTSDLVRYLSPPGPDFIIITLVPVHSDCDILADLQTKSFKYIEDLLGYLKEEEPKCININTTMGKNYGMPRSRPNEDVTMSSGESKGKALIIHNRTDREKWEIEHEHACRVLGEQLGLQVECAYDKSADDMLTAIAEFSKSSGNGSLAALSIMSHGDLQDNICGDGGNGLCSVQQVIDAFCQPDIQSVTKLVFLNFCRGPINSRVNRTNSSWESVELRDTVQMTRFNPIRANVDQERLDSVRQSHPFPSVDVPLNCYICYSTLPDTKSLLYNLSTQQANKMFHCLSEHLADIYKYSTLYKRVDSTHTLSYTTDSESDNEVVDEDDQDMVVSSSEQDVAVSTQQQLPRVELIPLLLDVAGIVREKSGFTQYMNLCYAIDKDSKPLIVEILPADKK